MVLFFGVAISVALPPRNSSANVLGRIIQYKRYDVQVLCNVTLHGFDDQERKLTYVKNGFPSYKTQISCLQI